MKSDANPTGSIVYLQRRQWVLVSTYIWYHLLDSVVNVGKYSIHGSHGNGVQHNQTRMRRETCLWKELKRSTWSKLTHAPIRPAPSAFHALQFALFPRPREKLPCCEGPLEKSIREKCIQHHFTGLALINWSNSETKLDHTLAQKYSNPMQCSIFSCWHTGQKAIVAIYTKVSSPPQINKHTYSYSSTMHGATSGQPLGCKTHCNYNIHVSSFYQLERPMRGAIPEVHNLICVSLARGLRSWNPNRRTSARIGRRGGVRFTTAPQKLTDLSKHPEHPSLVQKKKWLQVQAIDHSICTRPLMGTKQNVRLATLLGDQSHIFRERVVFRKTLPGGKSKSRIFDSEAATTQHSHQPATHCKSIRGRCNDLQWYVYIISYWLPFLRIFNDVQWYVSFHTFVAIPY